MRVFPAHPNAQHAPLVLDAHAIRKILPHIDIVSVMREMFSSLSVNHAVQPPQRITEFPVTQSSMGGDFITYLGVLAEQQIFGAKLSPYIVTGDRPIVTAWTSLMSMQTGQPLLFCDAQDLTRERTAATTALAVDLLARPDAENLAIIGSGAIAMAHYQHVKNLRAWTGVKIYSPGLSQNPQRLAAWRAICPDLIATETAEQSAEGADVIMLCTSSGTPVLDLPQIGSRSLVTSVSTNAVNAHEISPAFLIKADVYCDYAATTPDTAGEMKLAARDHGWQASELKGDLAQLVSGQCARPAYNQPVFFRSVGLGLEDVAIAHAIWVAAQQTAEQPA